MESILPACDDDEHNEQHDRENRSAIKCNLLRALSSVKSEKEECNLVPVKFRLILSKLTPYDPTKCGSGRARGPLRFQISPKF